MSSSSTCWVYERPAEVDLLLGNPSKAKHKLGWEPKVKFSELVGLMVDADQRDVGSNSQELQSKVGDKPSPPQSGAAWDAFSDVQDRHEGLQRKEPK